MPRVGRIYGIIAKGLGALLLTAALLKGYGLVTEPVAGNSLWTWRPFLILQIECELVLGAWLVSGLFPKVAWLVALACFSFFSAVTLYKGLTGADSCGCFGSVHVNPWVTLLVIDLPAVLALSVFRPPALPACVLSSLHRLESIRRLAREFLTPFPSPVRFVTTACLTLVLLGITAPILAFNKPAAVTARYEVLEPETWVGKELPILEQIDIADALREGAWLLLFYHYDCPDCRQAIPQYGQMARDLAGNEDFLRIALIEVPPYGPAPLQLDRACARGRLAATKEWFITTPVSVLLVGDRVQTAWEAATPDLDTILLELTEFRESADGAGRQATVPRSRTPS